MFYADHLLDHGGGQSHQNLIFLGDHGKKIKTKKEAYTMTTSNMIVEIIVLIEKNMKTADNVDLREVNN